MNDTDDTIAVVEEAELIDNAYALGYAEFEGMDAPEDGEEVDISHFKGSSRWANTLAPRLRAMSGFGDVGTGTYRVGRTVALVRTGDGDDSPAVAERMAPQRTYEAAVDAFDMGALDAWHDRERNPQRAPDV